MAGVNVVLDKTNEGGRRLTPERTVREYGKSQESTVQNSKEREWEKEVGDGERYCF